MLHAILVDDEEDGLRSLELLLDGFKEEVKIVGSSADVFEAIELINSYRPDIVFLDISMPELNGFELLDRLQFRNFHLVFTTAHRNYGLRALKEGASDYLLKPVDREELADCILKIRSRIKEEKATPPDIYEVLKTFQALNSTRILLPTRTSTEYVLPADIIYIEADSRYSHVYLSNEQSIQVLCNLKEFEKQICNPVSAFLRVHNSFIINTDYVTRYIKDDGGFAVMRGQKMIPVSKQKKEEFLKAINFLK